MPALLLEHRAGPLKGATAVGPTEERRITLGRGDACQVRYPDAATGVSLEHAELERVAGYYALRLNTVDPVYVNGSRALDGYQLQDGDEVALGAPGGPSFVARYHYAAAPLHAPDASRDESLLLQRTSRGQLLSALLLVVVLLMIGFVYVHDRDAQRSLGRHVAEVAEVASRPNPDAFAAVLESVRPSVYLVLAHRDSVGESPIGTAWVIAPHVLATNAHVADDVIAGLQAKPPRTFVLRSPVPPYQTVSIVGARLHPAYGAFQDAWLNYSPIWVDDDGQPHVMQFVPVYDVALLVGDLKVDLAAPLQVAGPGDLEALRPGDPVAYAGYPAERLAASDWTQPAPTTQVASLVGLETATRSPAAGKDAELLLNSLPATGGASGSPVVNAAGRVVGMLSAVNMTQDDHGGRLPSAAQINFAQRIDLIQPLLADTVAVDLDTLRSRWASDLRHYRGLGEFTHGRDEDLLKEWRAHTPNGGAATLVLQDAHELKAGETVEHAPGLSYSLNAQPGHYLVICESRQFRDLELEVTAPGGAEENPPPHVKLDFAPIGTLYAKTATKITILVEDSDFGNADEPAQRSQIDLRVYYAPLH